MNELEDTISEKTRVLVSESVTVLSHKPLGKVFSAGESTAIGNICVAYGVIIHSDEVYERLHYTKHFPRIATLDSGFARNTVTIEPIGKSFSATGWRVGCAISDQDLIKHIQAAHIILSFTTAGPAQLAAAKGLEQAEQTTFWDDDRREMKRKIDSLSSLLKNAFHPRTSDVSGHHDSSPILLFGCETGMPRNSMERLGFVKLTKGIKKAKSRCYR